MSRCRWMWWTRLVVWVDSYSAVSGDDTVVTAAVEGSVVTFTGVAAGSATVSVTATNAGGSVSQDVAVTVVLPAAPTVGTAVEARSMRVGEIETFVASPAFQGTVRNFDAVSNDETVVTAGVGSGSLVVLVGVAAGSATVSVTATNAGGSVSQDVAVTVTSAAPTVGTAVGAQSVTVGEPVSVDVVDAFGGVVDSYSAVSGDDTVVTAAVEGSVVTFTGVAAGSATVSVTATNAGGSVSQDVAVTVVLPAAPTVGTAVGAQSVTVGEPVSVDVVDAFGGVVDSYSAVSGDDTVVTAAVEGSVVTFTGVAAGSATVSVTATNAGGSVSQDVAVTVVLPAAPTVGTAVGAQSVTVGEPVSVDVVDAFGGVVDSYSAVSGDDTVVTAAVGSGSLVVLVGVAAGSATVTVTATNAGGSVSQDVAVTVVLPAAPTVGTAVGAQSVTVG